MQLQFTPQKILSKFFALAAGLVAFPALAGPPYATDDPIPADYGKWEIITFAERLDLDDGSEVEAGLDVNYGVLPRVQLSATLPLASEDRDGGSRVGLGDLEVGVKYLLAKQAEDGDGISVALYPSMTLPTARAGLGSKKVGFFLPVWAEKEFGSWSIFGGGGYAINGGDGEKNNWSGGVAITHQFGERVNFGAEVYHEAARELDGVSVTGAALGAEVKLNDTLSLLVSAGPVLTHRSENGRFTAYAGIGLAL